MRFDPEAVDWAAFASKRRKGVYVKPLWRDEAGGDAVVLVRMDPGCRYPRHRHVGDEEVFVLQGGFTDEFGEWPAGSFHRFPAGSVHSPLAFAEGPACVLFAVAHGGIDVLD
jgi:anti-sigma factor ChrR (cupin superfamily)